MRLIEKINSNLLELKDNLEFIGLPEMLNLYAHFSGIATPSEQGGKICRCIIHAIKTEQEVSGLDVETLTFDLKDFDPLFSFGNPPRLWAFHLLQALKAISKDYTPETLNKYAYIGFNREQIGQILGVDFYTAEQRQQLKQLQEQLRQAHESRIKPGEQTENKANSEIKDQIIVTLCQELADVNPKYKRGNHFNKSALAVKCSTSKMSYLFNNPKGQETYRATLAKLQIPIQ